MEDLSWSNTEKRVARAAFDRAVKNELAELIADFKRRAAAVESPDEMWALRDYLKDAQSDFDRKYDYRYSHLIIVFGHLFREGRISEDDLEGLSTDKLERIRRFATFI